MTTILQTATYRWGVLGKCNSVPGKSGRGVAGFTGFAGDFTGFAVPTFYWGHFGNLKYGAKWSP